MRAGRANLRPMGGTEGRKDGHMEIPPCVLQDISPLGPLLKRKKRIQGRKESGKEESKKQGRIHGQ